MVYLYSQRSHLMFEDRAEAGQELAEELVTLEIHNPVIVALPRGGVIVGNEIARKLRVPLHVLAVHKLSAPHNIELALGAIAEPNVTYYDKALMDALFISKRDMEEIEQREWEELERRKRLYRYGKPLSHIRGKTVILVDDGLATGSTALAAIESLEKMGAQHIIVAVPVSDAGAAAKIQKKVDALITLHNDEALSSVGSYYFNFDQNSDQEIIDILESQSAGTSTKENGDIPFSHA